jgi:hypothetical protein
MKPGLITVDEVRRERFKKVWREGYRPRSGHGAKVHMHYINRIPKSVEEGRVLVHNHIRHTTRTQSGVNGFRYWTQDPEPERLVCCDCGWSGLEHYRVKREELEPDRRVF